MLIVFRYLDMDDDVDDMETGFADQMQEESRRYNNRSMIG